MYICYTLKHKQREIMKILEKTFDQMPRMFTSNAFNSQAVKNGYPKHLLKNNGLAWFLHKYADNDRERSKTWVKRNTDPIYTHEISKEFKFKNVDEMIAFLKSKGYKIMKPVSDWVEC